MSHISCQFDVWIIIFFTQSCILLFLAPVKFMFKYDSYLHSWWLKPADLFLKFTKKLPIVGILKRSLPGFMICRENTKTKIFENIMPKKKSAFYPWVKVICAHLPEWLQTVCQKMQKPPEKCGDSFRVTWQPNHWQVNCHLCFAVFGLKYTQNVRVSG